MVDWNNTASWQILLVEDEIDNQEVLSETLDFYGISTKAASNGVEGLAVLQSYTPTLIITDLSMPQMDGWEFKAAVRENPTWNAIPVLALSAHAMAGDKERALTAGFDGYLTKPISARTLLEDIRSALEEGQRNASPNGEAVAANPVASTPAAVPSTAPTGTTAMPAAAIPVPAPLPTTPLTTGTTDKPDTAAASAVNPVNPVSPANPVNLADSSAKVDAVNSPVSAPKAE